MKARNMKTGEILELEMLSEGETEEKVKNDTGDAAGQAFCIIFIPGSSYALIPAEEAGKVTALWGEAETIHEMPEAGMVMSFDGRCLRRIDGETMAVGGSPIIIFKAGRDGEIAGLDSADIFAVQEALKARKAMIVNACGAVTPAFSVE